jgi:uncharacterized protein DUF3147
LVSAFLRTSREQSIPVCSSRVDSSTEFSPSISAARSYAAVSLNSASRRCETSEKPKSHARHYGAMRMKSQSASRPEAILIKETIFRFIVGGVFVSTFALSADILRPKSFAGIFGAAPSVALATLILTLNTKGAEHAAIEARSMIGGALALFVYAACASRAMIRWQIPPFAAVTSLLLLWLAVALFLWAIWLK